MPKIEEKTTESPSSFILELLETFVTSLVVLLVIYWTVALPEVVKGASMEPTFYSDERILVEKISRFFKTYERGDVVVLHPPGDEDVDYIKRIVGVPGDIVKVFDCEVYVAKEGEKFKLEEPYLYSGTCTSDGPRLKEGRSIKLEANEYLVLGDNRSHSVDSRIFGLIGTKNVVGKVVFRFWPLDRAEIF